MEAVLIYYELGQLISSDSSMRLAIEKAKKNGVGWVSAKGSNHFGICQWYTEMAMKEGLIGIASTNTSPLVAPTRAKTVIFGTNPIAVVSNLLLDGGSRSSNLFQ